MHGHDGNATAKAAILVGQLRYLREDQTGAGDQHHQAIQEAADGDRGNQAIHRQLRHLRQSGSTSQIAAEDPRQDGSRRADRNALRRSARHIHIHMIATIL